jgi:hypothetical protein
MDAQDTIKAGNAKTFREIWLEKVKKHTGALFVWVDQSTDPLLKANSSKGVCFAMAFDFVTAFHVGQPGPKDFINEIQCRALVWPNTSRIPTKYLEMQAAYEAMLDQYVQNRNLLTEQYENAERENKKALAKKLLQFMDNRIQQRFGPGMESHEKYKQDDKLLAPFELFIKMKANVAKKGASYFLVGMRQGSAVGHAVAFGFRNDLSMEVYEYFDANLGLCVFTSEKDLADFFLEVWTDLYPSFNFSSFEIASYTARKGKR